MIPERVRRVLVCLRYGIGDVVMETPVLESLRGALPAARIVALGAAPATELLESDPRVDEVVAVGRWGLRHRWDRGTAEARAGIGAWFVESAFDLVLDASQAPVGVEMALGARGAWLLDSDERAEAEAVAAGRGAVEVIKAGVRAGWGLEVPDSRPPRLVLPDRARAEAARVLAGAGVAMDSSAGGLERTGARPADAPIGILPVASLGLKRWPAERFAFVADRLFEATGRPVLLFADPAAAEARAVLGAMRHAAAARVVGAMHLQTTAALLARCALVIANDTGLLHVAAAVGTPTVGIFGPTNAHIFRPRMSNARAAHAMHVRCPHRTIDSLHPPRCWMVDECLIARESCILEVHEDHVLGAALELLEAAGTGRVGGGGAPGAAVSGKSSQD